MRSSKIRLLLFSLLFATVVATPRIVQSAFAQPAPQGTPNNSTASPRAVQPDDTNDSDNKAQVGQDRVSPDQDQDQEREHDREGRHKHFAQESGNTDTDNGTAHIIPEWLMPGHVKNKPYHRIMRYWQAFSNQRMHLLPSFTFLEFFALLAWYIFPGKLTQASNTAKQEFWPAVVTGLLTVTLTVTAIKILFLTGFGMPLALQFVAAGQLALLFGTSIAAQLFGEKILSVTKFGNTINERPRLKRMLEITLGALVLSLIAIIPGIGVIPPMGVRLVILNSMLGLGALLRNFLAKNETALG